MQGTVRDSTLKSYIYPYYRQYAALCCRQNRTGFGRNEGTLGGDGQTPDRAPETPVRAKFEPYKGKIRKSGTGCVTMINDHLYEGRFSPRVNGKRIAKNIYATTREECEEKLKVLIEEMKKEIAEIKAGEKAINKG